MGYLNMFIVIGFNDNEVKLENTEGNEIETVSWDEVARRLLNNICLLYTSPSPRD